MRPRIGVLGYAHETNALAAPISLHDGVRIDRQAGGLGANWVAGPAVDVLAESGAQVVELPLIELPPGGPLRHRDFVAYLSETEGALLEAGTLDALLVLGHGAGCTTKAADADGVYLELLRRTVGPEPSLTTVLDLHANVSEAMVRSVDAIVGYRTNPHVDVAERSREAAALALQTTQNVELGLAWCSLPLLLSQLGQLTTGAEPLGRVIDRSQTLVKGPVLNISVFGGFSLGDSPDAGLSVTVTAATSGEGSFPDSASVATEVADWAWQLRREYRSSATPLSDAVKRACHDKGPLLLADVADNPGGGAPGTSTALLGALLGAGASDVQLALQCDPRLVQDAFGSGLGAKITAVFNRGSTDPLAATLAAQATVTALRDGLYRPTTGVYAGATLRPGPTCTLDLGGVTVGVSSHPLQVSDPGLLTHVGLDSQAARVLVVKSRGHFRAGFAHMFDESQIVEVDAPGLAPVDLSQLSPVKLRRPIYPIDVDLADLDPDLLTRFVRSARGGRRHR